MSDMMQFIGKFPPVKRSWEMPDGRTFFETGEFILVTDAGMSKVNNMVYEMPPDFPDVQFSVGEVTADGITYKATMKTPRIVSIEWDNQR